MKIKSNDKIIMIPQYKRLGDTEKKLIKIPFNLFAIIVVSLPLFSFIFCVIWSVIYYFERSTSTHCDVRNYLPSISAAIGNYEPQRFIWQLSICLHIIPRFIIARMYFKHYIDIIRINRRSIIYLLYYTNLIENIALLILSLWTSSEHYEIHKVSFIIFIIMSEIYMIISYFLNKNGRKLQILNHIEEKSIKYKKYLCIINITAFSFAGYFFMRHNTYCEPGVYTLFALFEYLVVITNMGFHMTAYWDFHNKNLAFDWIEGLYFTHA